MRYNLFYMAKENRERLLTEEVDIMMMSYHFWSRDLCIVVECHLRLGAN